MYQSAFSWDNFVQTLRRKEQQWKKFWTSPATVEPLTMEQDKVVKPYIGVITLVAFLGAHCIAPAGFALSAAQAKDTEQRRLEKAREIPAPAWYVKSQQEYQQKQQAMRLAKVDDTKKDHPEKLQQPVLNPGVGPQGSKPGVITPSEPIPCKNGDCEVTTKALDLSRAPSEKELRMAGQLGGALSPTHEIADPKELEDKLNKGEDVEGVATGAAITTKGARVAAPAKKGPKTPEEIAKRVKRLKDINLDFGAAIQDWNKHNFVKAAKLFKKHMEEYPDSPWAGEAELHLGCDAKYNGRFSEAEETFNAIIQKTSSDPKEASFEIHQKAKARWADLDLALGRMDEASAKLKELIDTDSDWRRRTWARHWLLNIDLYKKNKRDLRACGSQALSVVMVSLKKQQAANKLAAMASPREAGFSLAEISDMSKKFGTPMRGFKARPEQLASLPTPMIIHFDFMGLSSDEQAKAKLVAKTKTAQPESVKGTAFRYGYSDGYNNFLKRRAAFYARPEKARQAASPFKVRLGSPGHYLVVRKVDAEKGEVTLYDPLMKRPYYMNFEQLDREWSGNGLLLAQRLPKGGKVQGVKTAQAAKASTQEAKTQRIAWLDRQVMNGIYGGCCGHYTPNQGLGSDCNESGCEFPKSGSSGVRGFSGSSYGSPTIKVNEYNLNVFVTDTPLWYRPAVGPAVEVTMNYNSQDSLSQNNPFGNKWMFNYGSYIVEDTGAGGGVVTVFMPDGQQKSYTPNGSGGYTPPVGEFNTLRKLSATRYEVEAQQGGKAIYDVPAGTSSLQSFLVELRDRFGKSLTFKYETQGVHVVMTEIQDAVGQKTRLTYDADGHIIRVTDPFERQASFRYDSNGNMVEAVDVEGQAFQYTYNYEAFLTELNSAQGKWKIGNGWGYYYTALHLTDPAGNSEQWGYTGYANYDYRDKRGTRINYNVGQTVGLKPVVTGWTYANSDGTSGTSVSRTYNSQGLPTSITNERGKSTTVGISNAGMPTVIKDAKNNTTTFTYASNGIDIASVVNAMGQTIASYVYDDKHQPTQVTDAVGNVTTLTYTNWGAPETVTTRGVTVTNTYNSLGQLITTKRGADTLATYTYDAVGRVRTKTDASNRPVTFEYDHLDRVIKTTFPDGTYEQREYVCCGLPGVVRDRAGRKTYYDYDPMKRLIRVQNAQGDSIQYDYDANGNRVQMLDGKGNITRWSYDNRNRLVKKTYHDGTSESYSYDVLNNVVTKTDARGRRVSFTYDDNNNLLQVDYANPQMADVKIAYNALNKPVRVVDGLGTTTYSYDNIGRPASVDGPFANDTIAYGYDAEGRQDWVKVQNSDGTYSQTSYDYDALKRLNNITSGAGAWTYNYNGLTSEVASLTMPNGARAEYSYNSLGQLEELDNLRADNSQVSRYQYGYDARGVRAWIESVVDDEPEKRVDYTYDSINQLTGEMFNEAPTPDLQKSYAYDAMGNRTSSTSGSGANLFSVAYTSNNLNQVTSYSTTPQGGTTTNHTQSYDANGNLTETKLAGATDPLKAYTYDDANRLVQVITRNSDGSLSHKSEYVYTYYNLKAISREWGWDASANDGAGAWVSQGEVRRLHYGLNVIQERDGTGATTVNYTLGLDLSGTIGGRGGIGGLLSKTSADGHFYYHYDGRGNVVQLTATNGSIQAEYSYDVYGNALNGSGAGAQAGKNPYRYSTKELVYGNLYDYGYRFYSPSMGTWINRDPIQEAGGLNVYSFNFNTPVNLNDPDGRNPFASAGIGAAWGIIGNVGGQIFANIINGRPWYCIKWRDVLMAGIAGAIDGFLGPLSGQVANALKGGMMELLEYMMGFIKWHRWDEGQKSLDDFKIEEAVASFIGGAAGGWGLPKQPKGGYYPTDPPDQHDFDDILGDVTGTIAGDILPGLAGGLNECSEASGTTKPGSGLW